MTKRQERGGYYGGSTTLTASGHGFSNPVRSPKRKQLERRRRLQAEADAFFAKRDAAAKKGKRDA